MAPWEIHPSLVHFPIAFLLGGVLLDLFAWWRGLEALARVATGLLIAGVATGLLAAGAGLLAFFTVPAHTEEAHAMMYWHSSLAVVSLLLFTGVAITRWRHRTRGPSFWSRAVGFVGGALVSIVGYLGGHIVYHGGAGIEPELLASTLQQAHQHGTVDDHGHAPSKEPSEPHPHGDEPDREQREEANIPHEAEEQPTGAKRAHAGGKHDQRPSDRSPRVHHAELEQGDEGRTPHEPEQQKMAATRAPEELAKIPAPDARSAEAPRGYRVEVALEGLDYPTSVEFDDAGAMYIAEGGYIYGDDVAPARILSISPEGNRAIVVDQLAGPVTDLLWHDGRLYVSQRGKISVLESSGDLRDLVTNLPSLGDHHNNQLSVGPDGKLYFGQGTATNSGVVGLDSFKMGWLSRYPEVRDVPAKDIRLQSQAFKTMDPLAMLGNAPPEGDSRETEHRAHPNGAGGQDGKEHEGHETDHEAQGVQQTEKDDHAGHEAEAANQHEPEDHAGHQAGGDKEANQAATVESFAFQPFATTPPDDGAVRGNLKANGTILRMELDGSSLEVYAWGLRNPFGVIWGPDDKLYASDNGYDERGSRPIAHAPDCLWEIKQGAWYGFPDYAGGVPVTDARFRPEQGPAPKFLMRDHPPVEKPVLALKHHVGAAKMDFSRSTDFGFNGQMFLALVGDMNPITGQHHERSGFEVIRIDPRDHSFKTFFRAKQNSLGSQGMEYVVTPGPKRPVDVRFSPGGGEMYVVDIGAMMILSTATGPVPRPFPGTGVIWRITRDRDPAGSTR